MPSRKRIKRKEAQPAKKDFFISFNKADREIATWVARTLEDNGYSVVFQDWDFRPGSNFVLEMDKAIRNTERIIAILSPDYLDALYTQSEWAAALKIDPTGEERRLLPMLVRKCDLKGLLAQIVYIDLLNKDRETMREVLLANVGPERGKPASELKSQGEASAPPSGNGVQYENDGERYAASFDQEIPNPKIFVDRKDAIDSLSGWLKDGQKTVCFLKGPSGRGKTYLAAKFFREIASSNGKAEPSARWQGLWVNCLTNKGPVDMEFLLSHFYSSIRESAEELDEEFEAITDRSGKLPFERLGLLWKQLRKDNWLVILNDYHAAESLEEAFGIKEFVKRAIASDDKIKVLVTTSTKPTKTKSEVETKGGCYDFGLGRLDRIYAQEYLQESGLNVNETQAARIWEKCGEGEPKAMDIFVGIVNDDRREVEELLNMPIPDWSDDDCDKWLNKMLSFLSGKEKEAAMAASIFFEPVEREAIEKACGFDGASRAVNGLIHTHLLDKLRGGLVLHRAVREYFQKQLLNRRRVRKPEKMHERVARWLDAQSSRNGLPSLAVLEYIRRAFFHWREAGKIDAALVCARKIEEYSSLPDRPEICAEALQMAQQSERREDVVFWNYRLAIAYLELSNITEANRHFVMALDQARQIGNKQFESEALYGLSQTAEEQDQFDEAIARAEEGLRVSQEIEDRIVVLRLKNIIQNHIIHLHRILKERIPKKGERERQHGESMIEQIEGHVPKTDSTGRCFLSYRRSRHHEAELLITAQHDRGVPTWQDINNLEELSTEDEIRRVLDDPTMASAILWLTPDVKDSNFIREIEAPLILERVRKQDGFFAIPLCAGGLKGNEVDEILNPRFSLENLSDWNLREVISDPINSAEAAKIAKLVLNRRIAAIHKSLPEDEPLRVELYTRTPAPFIPGTALLLDWSERFDERLAKSGAWEDHLLPALKDVVGAMQMHAAKRSVEVSGLAAIPTALALGYECMETRGIRIAWRQPTKGRDDQLWSLDVSREPSGFKTETISGGTSAKHLAVLVSVAADADAAFAASRDDLEPFRAVVRVFKPGREKNDVATPEQARDISEIVSIAIRDARLKYRPTGIVHLFVAAPIGLAMMIGQKLNTLGSVQTYEHLQTDLVGRYQPAVLLTP